MPSVFYFISCALLSAAIGNATCYWPNGTLTHSTYVPCNYGVTSMCCDSAMNDTCTASGLCYHSIQGASYWRDACTDKTWTDPGCVGLCPWTNNASQELTQCGDGSWCCGSGNSTCCQANEGVMLLPTAGATTVATAVVLTTTTPGATTTVLATTTTSVPTTVLVSISTSGTTPVLAQTPTSTATATLGTTTTLGPVSDTSGFSLLPQTSSTTLAATSSDPPAIAAATTPAPSLTANSNPNAIPIGIGLGLGLGLSVIATILGTFLWHKRRRPMSINATFVVSDEKYPFPHNDSPATDCTPDYPIPSYSAATNNMQDYRGISFPIKGTSEAQYHNYLRSEKSGLNGLTVFELP